MFDNICRRNNHACRIFLKSRLYSWKFCLIKVIPRKCFDATELCGKTDADCFPVLFSEQLKGFAMIILLTVSFVTFSKTQQSGRDECIRLHGSASYCSPSWFSPGAKMKHIAFLQAFGILHWWLICTHVSKENEIILAVFSKSWSTTSKYFL